MKKFLILLTLVFISQFLEAQGCSQCRILSEQGSGLSEDSFTNNLNYGILYLMAFPYLILMFLFRKQIGGFIKNKFLSKNQPQ